METTDIEENVLDEKIAQKLYNIASEILSTETAYVHKLKLIEDHFHAFFLNKISSKGNSKTYPPRKFIDSIFLNLPSILDFHNFLLPDLENAIQNWDKEQKLGLIFKKLAPFIKLYAVYISGYGSIKETIDVCCKKWASFSKDLDCLQKDQKLKSLTLLHLMLEPVQRVPRYKMLLADYKKYLPESHCDFKDLEEALSIVVESADHANNRIKEFEMSNKLSELQHRITSNVQIIVPGRVITKEGELNRHTSSKSKSSLCFVVLFSDILIDCSFVASKKLKHRSTFELFSTKLITKSEDLTFKVSNGKASIIYAAKTMEEKNSWTTAILGNVAEIIKKRATFKTFKKNRTQLRSDRSGSMESLSSANLHVKFPTSGTVSVDSNGSIQSTEYRRNISFHPILDGKMKIKLNEDEQQPEIYFLVITMKRQLVVFDKIDLTIQNSVFELSECYLSEIFDEEETSSFKIFDKNKEFLIHVYGRTHAIAMKWYSMISKISAGFIDD